WYLRSSGARTLMMTLTSSGALAVSGAVSGSLWTGSPIGADKGGTAQSSWTTGDLLYASGTNTLAKRGIGSSGQVLTVSGRVPTWATPAAGPKAVEVLHVNTRGAGNSGSSETVLMSYPLPAGQLPANGDTLRM